MKELVNYMARALASQPDQVIVTEVAGENENGSLMELRVADADVNHLIGKQGRTVKAMRSLLMAASAKAGKKCRLKIVTDANDAESGVAATEKPCSPNSPGEAKEELL